MDPSEPDPATGPGPLEAATPRWERWALALLATLPMLAIAGLGLATVLYPYQTSYVEGYLLEQAQRLAQGGSLYREVSQAPWLIDNFTPVYPALLAGTVELLGVSFGPGRALTLAAVAGLAALIHVHLRRQGTDPLVSLGLVGLTLASPYLIRRAMLLRMDLAGILAAAGGLLLYLAWREQRPRLAQVLAVGLFALALGIRQTLVAAPLALLAGLTVERRWREAGRLLVPLAAIAVVAVLALQAWTEGRFWRHVVLLNLGEYHAGTYLQRVLWAGLRQPVLLALGAIGAWQARASGLEGRVLGFYVLAAALSTATSGKGGSTYNHFLELLVAAALVSGPGLERARAWLADRLEGPWRATRVLTVLLAVQLVVAVPSGPVVTAVEALEQGDQDGRLVEILAAAEGPVLSENAGAVVLAGHQVTWEPRTLHELHRVGAWDDGPLVAQLEAQAYSVVVVDTFQGKAYCEPGCRWTEAAWQALQAGYAPAEDLGRWQVWRRVG